MRTARGRRTTVPIRILRKHVIGGHGRVDAASRIDAQRQSGVGNRRAGLGDGLAAHVRHLQLARASRHAHRRKKEDAECHAERAGHQKEPAGGPHAGAERSGRDLDPRGLQREKVYYGVLTPDQHSGEEGVEPVPKR
jgi:hypothetical protein